MSEVRVNKISPRSGTTVTLGDNGDTITIPSGVTLDASSGGLAGTLTTAAQPNITSVGTLTSFTSTGIDDNATSTAITINSSEQVGIGTASPSEILHIEGNSPYLVISNTGENVGGIKMYDSADSGGQYFHLTYDSASSNEVSFDTGASGEYTFNVNTAEKMRIDSSGKVSIGDTTSSGYRLKIKGTIANDADDQGILLEEAGTGGAFIKYDGAANLLKLGGYNAGEVDSINIVRNTGDVGIGTTSPGTALQVKKDWVSDYGSINISHSTDSLGGLGIRCNNVFKAALIYKGGTSGALLDLGTYAAEPITFRTNNSERMRIDSSGNVGIGTTSPGRTLHVKSGASTTIRVDGGTDGSHAAFFESAIGGTVHYQFGVTDNSNNFSIYDSQNAATRFLIDSSGNLLVGKTSQNNSTAGVELQPSGILVATRADTPLLINRLSTDGILVLLQQQNNTEGTISVAGSTVSYNGFTGTHWSRFQDNSTPTILRGTVLETLDEMCDWYNLEFDVTTQDEDGNDVTNTSTKKVPHVLLDSQSNGDVITYNHEGTDYQATIVKENDVKHMMSKVSDNSDAKNVYGVFVAYDLDGEGYNDFYVASVGSFVVRIKANETIAKGDLLQSNGDGTAKVQSDDNIKSSSFAKVLSTTIIETYEDGSYLVPCSLMC
jgi:hypothetical protein